MNKQDHSQTDVLYSKLMKLRILNEKITPKLLSNTGPMTSKFTKFTSNPGIAFSARG